MIHFVTNQSKLFERLYFLRNVKGTKNGAYFSDCNTSKFIIRKRSTLSLISRASSDFKSFDSMSV